MDFRHISYILLFAAILLAIPTLSVCILSNGSVAEMGGVDLDRSDDVATVSSDLSALMFSVDGIWYTTLDDSSVSVHQCDPSLSAVALDIPSTVTSPAGKEYAVVEIARNAFSMNGCFESVSIPDTVRRIGKDAFANCSTIVTLSIPIDVICEKNAFKNVEIGHLTLTKGATGSSQNEYWKSWVDSIETLTVGEGITEFRTVADWKKLFSITLKDVRGIGKDQFSGCEVLLEVHAPNVSEIGEHAFEYCTSLRTLDLGPVTDIGEGAFHGCRSIVSTTGNIFLSDGMLFIPIDDWRASVVHYVGDDDNRLEMPMIVDAQFGKRYVVTSISAEAFMDATDLSDIIIPYSILDIGAHAFKGCESLKTITMPIGADCRYGTDSFAFKGVKPTVLSLTDGGYDPDTYTMNEFWRSWESSLQSLRVERGITEFGSPFKGKVLKELILVDVREIHKDQFKNCKDLSSITASNVSTIGEHAFKGCSDLSSIDFHSVESIGKKAFSGCKSITTIILPIGVECHYGTKNYAFDGLKPHYLTLVDGGYDPDTYMGNEFWKPWAPHIQFLNVEAGITEFGTSFKNGDLVSVALESVQMIHEGQFEGCEGLMEVHAPNVGDIGERAFMRCTSLQTLEIGHVTSLGKSAFHGCRSITSVTGNLFIHNGLLLIPIDDSRASVVQYLRCLEDVLVIPEAVTGPFGKEYVVTSISAEAFMGATDLSNICIPDVILDIGAHAFKGCGPLTLLSVPIGADCRYGTEWFAFEGVKPSTFVLTHGGYDPDTYMSNEFWKPLASSIQVLCVAEGITEFETSFEGKDLNAISMIDVRTIHKDQFRDCSKLVAASITGARYIEESAFQDCECLMTVACGNLNGIGNSAFRNCHSLVKFAATNVEIINEKAFYKCEELESFPFIGTTRIDSKAFSGTQVPAPTSFLLGRSGIDIADDAFKVMHDDRNFFQKLIDYLSPLIKFVVKVAIALFYGLKFAYVVSECIRYSSVEGVILSVIVIIIEMYYMYKMGEEGPPPLIS